MAKARYEPKVRKLSQTTFLVQSQSDPLIEYKVTNLKGDWRCTCPHFMWRCTGTADNCKHISLAQKRFPESLNVKFRQRALGGKLLSERMKEG